MDTSVKAAGARASDGELLEQFSSRGDQQAFSELIRRHGPMVVRICRRLNGGDAHAADDAAQQVFLALASRAGVLRTRVSVAGWLYRTSWHIAARHRRAEGLRADHEQRAAAHRRGRDTAAADGNGDVPFAVVTAELSAALDRALGTLPENHRNALVLHHLAGLTVEETAQRMAVKVGTAASWLSRGRAALRAKLEDMGYAVSLGVVSAWLDANAAAAQESRRAAPSTPGSGAGSLPGGLQSGEAGGALALGVPVPALTGAAVAAAVPAAAAASMFGLSRTAAITAAMLFACATTVAAGHAAVTHLAALTQGVSPSGSARPAEDESSRSVERAPSRSDSLESRSASAAIPEPSSCVILIAAGGLALLRRPARVESPGG